MLGGGGGGVVASPQRWLMLHAFRDTHSFGTASSENLSGSFVALAFP